MCPYLLHTQWLVAVGQKEAKHALHDGQPGVKEALALGTALGNAGQRIVSQVLPLLGPQPAAACRAQPALDQGSQRTLISLIPILVDEIARFGFFGSYLIPPAAYD